MTESDIDDALSKASFRAWRGIDSYDSSKGSLRAWFYVIARNAGAEITRERRKLPWEVRGDEIERAVDPNPPLPQDPAEGDASVLIPQPPRAFREVLRECIEQLPRMQRHIIEADLQTGDVADAGELARVLDTTRNSIYVSRSHARKALKRLLTQRGVAPAEGGGLGKEGGNRA